MRPNCRYVALFRRRLEEDGAGRALPQEELDALRELEARLPMQMLLALRGRAEEQVDAALEAAKLQGSKRGGAVGAVTGLFSRLFKGWRRSADGAACTEVAGVELEVSPEELCTLCGAADEAAFDDLDGAGRQDPRFAVDVAVPKLRVEVSDHKGYTGAGLHGPGGIISAVEFLGTQVALVGKPMRAQVDGAAQMPFSADVRVAGVVMHDLVCAASVFPEVVRSGTALDPGGPPSFHVRFEVAPPDSNASYLLQVCVASPPVPRWCARGLLTRTAPTARSRQGPRRYATVQRCTSA
jgi:hypothetical protein